MIDNFALLAAALACAANLAAMPAGAAPVQTESGLAEGLSEAGVTVYKGLPFAAPPVGPLRWRAPEAPAKWDGVKLADKFSPVCMQKGMYPEDAPAEPMSEDCLYLNVWIPQGAQGPLPVMVWIYGGGLQNGSASTPLYWGEKLAQRGVILVTANYRLGALGFLAHPELTAESPAEASGNYGLLDQLAALKWVQRNIAAFGGDPQNVTVFGQSSGAISISALMASPLAKGLFKRAIGQSGGLFEPLEAAPEFWLKGAEASGLRFAEHVGAKSLQDLRAIPAEKILEKRFNPKLIVDGHVLVEPPFAAFGGRRQNNADLLVGSNKDEGLYFINGRTITPKNLTETLSQDFPGFIVSLIGPGEQKTDAAARAAFVALEGQMRFGWDMWTWARIHANAKTNKVFYYRFAHAPPATEGASHGAELRYVFDHLDQTPMAWSNHDRRIADLMAAYWTNFAKTGNPNADGLPPWFEFTAAAPQMLTIAPNMKSGVMAEDPALAAIDRLYTGVRIAYGYGYGIAGAFILALGALTGWIVLRLRRRSL